MLLIIVSLGDFYNHKCSFNLVVQDICNANKKFGVYVKGNLVVFTMVDNLSILLYTNSCGFVRFYKS